MFFVTQTLSINSLFVFIPCGASSEERFSISISLKGLLSKYVLTQNWTFLETSLMQM